ncbi:MAG TPA: alpha/beta hydrolase, partial [Acidimicrobiales bacterium]|nr:alpha/beta hydrolase [Acidimicrobiales bacterium]
MPDAINGAVRLHYESFGVADRPAMLLINGWGSQLLSYPEAFCEALVARGLWVTRFDNRDAGLSTHLDGVDARVGDVIRARRAGAEPSPPYTLADMAEDARAVLDALGAQRAHVVG